jgi:type II secretory pathway pseudopilin PulG
MKVKAFTFLEVVVVMGILVAIALLVLPYTISQIEEARAENQSVSVASELFSQQQDAYAGKNNSAFGVSLEEDAYTVFRGTSLAAAAESTTITLPSGVTIQNISLTGGATEIVFPVNSFRPNVSGSFRLNDGNSVFEVGLNAQGLITVTKI